MERPAYHITINERAENSSTDRKASVGLGVHVQEYYENVLDWPSDGNDDVVKLRISATANTRKILSYAVDTDPYSWHGNLSNRLFLGDDDGAWVYMSNLKARFYGGPGSAEYTQVWVSSNGFISFDNNSTTPYYYPYSIPNIQKPNTFVAPFWRDLEPNSSGSITYGIVYHQQGGMGPYKTCFAISWNGVPDKNGNHQTFQVLIENAPTENWKHIQSMIWFQYQSITLDDQTTVGIEDQQGGKGTAYNYQSLGNSRAIRFEQNSNSALVGTLKIKLSENEDDATTAIDRNDESIRGYNVVLNQSLPDEQEQYAIALAGLEIGGGALSLLISGLDLLEVGGKMTTAAGFMLGAVLIAPEVYELGRILARQQAEARLLSDNTDWHTYATAWGVVDSEYPWFISEALDASFDILSYWVLTDPNNKDHSLTITAELTYVVYSGSNIVATNVISTSVNLKLTRDANNDFDTATTVGYGEHSRVYLGGIDTEDYYKFWAEAGQVIFATLTPPSGADFDLFLHDPNRQERSSSTQGGSYKEYIWFLSDVSGYWFLKMKLDGGSGFYTFYVDVWWQSSGNGGGGGGGCPYLLAWNGSRYVLDNNLLPASESSCEVDITDHYMLQQTLTPRKDGTYSLILAEFESEHDFLDRLRLIALDHSPSVKAAVSPDGEILTYTTPIPPVSAIDDNQKNVKGLLNSVDGSYYEGSNQSYVTMNFGDVDVSDGAKLVLRADANHKRSIYIQVQDSKGNWNTVRTVIPRVHWATEIIDMHQYLPDGKGNLKVRLYFTANHKLDFVGLDTSPQATIQTQEVQLISATHSREADITYTLLHSDQTYGQLMPLQSVQLSFNSLPQTTEKRDFIIIVEGHYLHTNGS